MLKAQARNHRVFSIGAQVTMFVFSIKRRDPLWEYIIPITKNREAETSP